MSFPTPVHAPADEYPDLVRNVVRGAWLGVLLGLSIELLLLSARLLQGVLPDSIGLFAGAVQKASWSSLVCATLAAGQSAARGRPEIAAVIGLLGAPIAFLLGRSLHKGVLEVLSSDAVAAPTPWLGAGIKSVEYALLGMAILWLDKRQASWKSYALLGATVGAFTYVLTLWALPADNNPLLRAITEITHPLGCALAVYVAASFHRRLRNDKQD